MSIRKRTWPGPDGEPREAWIVDYRDQGGRRRLKTFTKKRDADAFAAQAKVDVRSGVHVADSATITVADASALWIESCRGRGLERSTVAAYERHARFHILPFLGAVKLSRLSTPLVREFEDRLRHGDDEAGAQRSPAMIRKIMTSLASLVSDAQERGYIANNPVRRLRLRRRSGIEEQAARRQEGRLRIGEDVPAPAEINSIVGALSGQWRPILLTLIFAGPRSSELRAIRWRDIDFKRGVLHVRQRVDQYMKFGPPKSATGERSIPLPPIAVAALKEWKLACPNGSLDLAFPTSNGHPIGHTDLAVYGWQRAQVAAGVTRPNGKAKYPGLHAARHFYAAWLINSKKDGGLGLSAKAAQTRLGHASMRMTMDVYGHWFPNPEDGSELAEAERELLG